MATGRLGAIDLPATTDTLLYEVPASTIATVNINVCNRTGSAVVLRLAHINGAIGTVANEDYIEYGISIAANGVLERTGIVMAAGHTLMAYADNTGLSIQAWGWEEAA